MTGTPGAAALGSAVLNSRLDLRIAQLQTTSAQSKERPKLLSQVLASLCAHHMRSTSTKFCLAAAGTQRTRVLLVAEQRGEDAHARRHVHVATLPILTPLQKHQRKSTQSLSATSRAADTALDAMCSGCTSRVFCVWLHSWFKHIVQQMLTDKSPILHSQHRSQCRLFWPHACRLMSITSRPALADSPILDTAQLSRWLACTGAGRWPAGRRGTASSAAAVRLRGSLLSPPRP